ncbi:MAG: type III secretion system export apparatus subunit SctT [Planctomycetota bacterium]|jgi:type III secretion protein T|nr:type III secretion system export apparatus subunit SctT [Planctomycetota bacterium]
MGELLELGEAARRFLWLVGLAMARLTPIFQIVPFLGGRHLTTTVRGSITLSLAAFLVPWLDGRAEAAFGFAEALPLLAKEAALGTIFGFFASLVFFAASGIGFLADNQRGMTMASEVDPISGIDTSPLGAMMMETMILAFVSTGGLALFIQSVLSTYVFWPPFSFWPDWGSAPVGSLLLDQFEWYLAVMVTLAAPMLLVCFLVDLGMGLMNRFAPQLNVYFLAMPIKSALVMALMLAYWGTLFRLLGRETARLPTIWAALSRVLGGT